ncbi:MAG: hypothetical protein AB1705_23340 [Verrucomicrobiota bacterium]
MPHSPDPAREFEQSDVFTDARLMHVFIGVGISLIFAGVHLRVRSHRLPGRTACGAL